jgi:hypothetical protein
MQSEGRLKMWKTKLTKMRDRIRELYLEGEKIREKQTLKPIPTLPFILTLGIGSAIGYFVGYFIYDSPFLGTLVGLAASFILFIVLLNEEG